MEQNYSKPVNIRILVLQLQNTQGKLFKDTDWYYAKHHKTHK